MRIMGIDPGTRIVGYGLIDKEASKLNTVASGIIKTPPKAPLPEKLKIIFDGLMSVIAEYSPEVIAIEDVFAGKGARSSMKIGEGRGVALLSAAKNDIAVVEYTATNVKLAVAGNGHASKQQVQKMVKVLLGLAEEPKAEDEADALAIAICHCHRSNAPTF